MRKIRITVKKKENAFLTKLMDLIMVFANVHDAIYYLLFIQ